MRKDVGCGLTSRHHLKSAVIGPWTLTHSHTHMQMHTGSSFPLSTADQKLSFCRVPEMKYTHAHKNLCSDVKHEMRSD